MFHDYAQVMPASQALAVTFDGSAACDLCHVSQTAQDAAREQLPRDAALGGGMDKFLLLADSVPTLVLAAPDFAWPSVIHNIGLTRTEMVPVTPPRV
jgi:hypothetical protein